MTLLPPALGSLVSALLSDGIDVGDAAQRQRERAGLVGGASASVCSGFSSSVTVSTDHRVLAILFLGRLVDREDADVRQDDLGLIRPLSPGAGAHPDF